MGFDLAGLLVFAFLVGVPAAVLACMPARWRVACFFLGLLLFFATERLIHSAHDPMAPMMFVGLGIALAALLVEIPTFAIRTVRRRRAVASEEVEDKKRPLRFLPKRK